jgi:4-hydroxy-3-polyprenylbenzoate decarboxylase
MQYNTAPNDTAASLPLAVAITGASGGVYAVRLLEVLIQLGIPVELVISPAGAAVLQQELGLAISLDAFQTRQLWSRPDGAPWWSVLGGPFPAVQSGWSDAPQTDYLDMVARTLVRYAHYQDYLAPLASGSHRTRGMVICPCSGGTLSGIAHGTSNNLILRAAEVHLKERRPLVVVPRETPLSMPYIDNMHRAATAGAVVLPASPGWYHGVKRLHDLVDFLVARILDQFQISHNLMRRWGE